MPKIKLDLPVCCRCKHVWLPELLPGETAARLINLKWVAGKRRQPECCARCKSPYWNKRRKNKRYTRTPARKPSKPQLTATEQAKAMSGADKFDMVMKAIAKKN